MCKLTVKSLFKHVRFLYQQAPQNGEIVPGSAEKAETLSPNQVEFPKFLQNQEALSEVKRQDWLQKSLNVEAKESGLVDDGSGRLVPESALKLRSGKIDPNEKLDQHTVLFALYMQREAQDNTFRVNLKNGNPKKNIAEDYVGLGEILPRTAYQCTITRPNGSSEVAVRSYDPGRKREAYYLKSDLEHSPPIFTYVPVFTGDIVKIDETLQPKEAEEKMKRAREKAEKLIEKKYNVKRKDAQKLGKFARSIISGQIAGTGGFELIREQSVGDAAAAWRSNLDLKDSTVSSSTNLEVHSTSQETTLGVPELLQKPVYKKIGKYDQYITNAIEKAKSTYPVPKELVYLLIEQESGGNERARSPVGAMGLMQLMPATARGLGLSPSEFYDPKRNVEGGVKLLAQLLKKYKGNIALALAAYNAGPGNVDKYKGVPPFKETQNYVAAITRKYRNLQQQRTQAEVLRNQESVLVENPVISSFNNKPTNLEIPAWAKGRQGVQNGLTRGEAWKIARRILQNLPPLSSVVLAKRTDAIATRAAELLKTLPWGQIHEENIDGEKIVFRREPHIEEKDGKLIAKGLHEGITVYKKEA